MGDKFTMHLNKVILGINKQGNGRVELFPPNFVLWAAIPLLAVRPEGAQPVAQGLGIG